MVKNVQILKTPGCSAYDKETAIIKKIKKEEKLTFKIEEIDIIQHPEMLQKYQLLTSPGIVIDGKLAFTGMPSESKLKQKLLGK